MIIKKSVTLQKKSLQLLIVHSVLLPTITDLFTKQFLLVSQHVIPHWQLT